MGISTENNLNKQYSIFKIIVIWLAAGVPMWVLGWLVYPALAENLSQMDAALMRIKLLGAGLVWQFALSMIILYQEEGNIRWETIRRRFWLNHPISTKTGKPNRRLWWWILPLIALTAVVSMAPINDLWTSWFPALAEPAGYSFEEIFESEEIIAQFKGAWSVLGLMVIFGIFNTFLGEEFVFRGVLLPKMESVFGKFDWVMNGVLFGLYHLHQPWGILASIISGMLFAWSGKHFKSNWFPIILHSGQTVLITFMILGLVLGLA